ncbi:hypothetical protein [Micromonospora rosaria]|uniref:hypothetical protein n=1 Tax=Micromonospora rosaria TaxID=47874 RepID=UPI0012F8F446|nr:hypothetical protein [Micromonospora rosaria]
MADVAPLPTVHRRQGAIVMLAFGSGGAALLVPGFAALAGQITVAQLVICLGAAWGVFRISGMGLEAFDIEYGLGAVRALDRTASRSGTPCGPVTAPDRREPAATPALIRFERVTFTHPGAAAC